MSSIKEQAERLANAAFAIGLNRVGLRDAFEQALRARDRRAVKIIEDHQAQDKCEDNCWTTIKAAIRNED